ncbi:MAG: amidohydrolase [Lysobacterales bacterium CG17_big_fil_post_rev_8_21_14_2_50_64_11]|nr:MAG: amidohydrolase [Xanthomonadales bacterium CG17_big_fil_post_rev_8_21_14_2_50_64_11]PIX59400.1 MAG: amidohydrolase [Xanthomonadales bacterium CG_4_10_14_3_um_filter_64_11]
MSLPDLRVTLLQGATQWHDPQANRHTYGELARSMAGNTDLVILPETFTSGFSNEALATAETMDGPSVAWLRELSVELGAAVTGSVQIRAGEGVYNRLLWATPDGALAHYDKRHLFRMAGEHERYAAGRERLTVQYLGWRICPLVCYDLRFPVFIRNRFGHEAPGRFDYDLLIVVANWPSPRRHAWRTLLRARAIENLACVAAVNRVGRDGNGIDYSGDSVVLDQLGAELVELGSQPHVATATLSGSALQAHRARFPAQLDADVFVLGGSAPA